MRYLFKPRLLPAIVRRSTPLPTVSRLPDISMKYLLRLAAASMAVAAVSPVHAAMDYFVTTQSEYDALNSTTFNPGDNIFLQGNTTFNGGLFFDPQDSGNNALGNLVDPITLTSFGSGRATIDSGDATGLYAFNNGGFNISNLNFRGSGVAPNGATTSTADGVLFFTDSPGNLKQNHIYLDNLDVSGFGRSGVVVGGFNGSAGYNDVRITNVAAHENRNSGIATFGDTRINSRDALTNVYVADSRAFNNFGDPASTGNTGSGIVLGGVDGGTVERSVAYNNGRNNNPTEGPVGIWAYDSNDVTIQFNESYDNTTSNGDGGGFDLDQNVTNSLLQYNYSHGNAGAGYLIFDGDGTAVTNSGNVVRYNISENDGRRGNLAAAGITVGGNVRDLEIYGNTVYITDATANANVEPAIKLDRFGATSPQGILVANNIFYTDGGGRLIFKGNGVTNSTDPTTGIRFLNNDYLAADGNFQVRWNNVTYTSLDAWLTAITGQERFDKNGDGTAEIVALNVDPLLTDPGNGGTVDPDAFASLTAYLLQEDSPLIDTGLNLARLGITVGPRDFDGTALPQGDALDIGADELVPEPGTAALLALAGITLLRRRREL